MGYGLRTVAWSLALALPGVAAALPPTPGAEIEVFLSGATAQDEALENLFLLKDGLPGAPNICEPGSLDIYRGEIAGTAKRIYYCRTSGKIAGVAAGKRLALHKSSGGSGEGVTPLASGTSLQYLDLSTVARPGVCARSRNVPARGDFAAYVDHETCRAGARSARPAAGLSDVEPELLVPGVSGLTARAQNQIVWGLPVTKNLRNALQAAQGLVPNTVPHDDPGRDREEVMPNLTHAQIAGIFAGTLTRWNQFYDRKGAALPVSQSLAANPAANPDAAGASPGAYRPANGTAALIHVCRRIASSGTQASFEVHYLRRRCTDDAPLFVAPDDGSDVERGGPAEKLVRVAKPTGRIFAGIGSRDVRACLDAHEHFNRWAIGLLSTENIGDNGAGEFRYVKADGYAPTLLNSAQGRWSHISEQSMQWRTDIGAELERTESGRVLRFVAANMGLPRVIRSLNSGFVHPFGDGGYLTPGGSGFTAAAPPLSAALVRDNPVSLVSKSLNRLNNCVDPISVERTSL